VRVYRQTASDLLQDVRYTMRSLPRSFAFTAAAVLTLALGIGANTAIFSIVSSVLLRPLPYTNPERLVSIWPTGGLSRGLFSDVRMRCHDYADIATYNQGGALTLTGRGDPERVEGSAITPNLFSVLGVAPALGRSFASTATQPGSAQVVMLSHELWQSRFGADANIVGRVVTLNGVSRTVAGVMPSGFHFPTRTAQVWIPIVMDTRNINQYWGAGGFWAVARMRDGVSVNQAQADLRAILPQVRHDNPVWDPGPKFGQGATVVSLQRQIASNVRPTLLILLAAVVVVLLIACVNVANLLLARGAAQNRAFAIRTALGASRRRLVGQMLTESLVISLIGAIAGLLIASAIVSPIAHGLLSDTHQLGDVVIDGRVLGFTTAIAVLTGIITGLLPALRASDVNLSSVLRDAGHSASTGAGQRRVSDAFVTLEVALAVMLVVGAGLLIRSFWELRNVDPGFNPQGVTSARIDLPPRAFTAMAGPRVFYTELLQRVAALPRVTSAAAVTETPLSNPSGMAFRVRGQIENLHQELPTAGGYHAITPGYLRTMAIPLHRGRDFTDADRDGAPDVVLVNEALARRYWPNRDPIGQQIGYPWESDWMTIVGVVGSVAEKSIGDPDTTMTIYRPFLQAPSVNMTLVVKSNASDAAIATGVRRIVASIDRTVPVSHVQTMDDAVSSAEAKPRFTMLLLSGFAAVALLLGALGIYGVISYSVEQRNREIGIRMALGARQSAVLRLVLTRGAVLAVTGAIVGLILSFAMTRSLASMIYGVTTSDPMTFILAPILLVVVALLASYIPARRAASVDPVTVLNAE
jgi:putative ABC transport system permease protein